MDGLEMALDWEKRLVEKLNIKTSDGVTGALIVRIIFGIVWTKQEKWKYILIFSIIFGVDWRREENWKYTLHLDIMIQIQI